MRRNRGGSSSLMFVTGGLMGAGLMFLMDPGAGARRRAFARQKLLHGLKFSGRSLDKVSRNLANRLKGAWAEESARLRQDVVDDDMLVERVRAQIGHVLSHPGAVFVEVRDGIVTVSGPVLRGESDKIRERLDKTRGVREYRVAVSEHDTDEGIPGLQGKSRRQKREGLA